MFDFLYHLALSAVPPLIVAGVVYFKMHRMRATLQEMEDRDTVEHGKMAQEIKKLREDLLIKEERGARC